MGRRKVFKDENGRLYWERRLVDVYSVPDGWTTDIYESVRDDKRLEYARFIEPSGRVFRIQMDDLRRVTDGIKPRAHGRRTFQVKPKLGLANGRPVDIEFEESRLTREEETPVSNTDRESHRKGWTAAESEWHRQTTKDVADYPEHYSIDINHDPIVRRWHDSCKAVEDERGLWLRLWTQKHPDAVFEHRSGKLTIVEVEPRETLLAGIAQLVGDYVANFDVDRRDIGVDLQFEGILVLDEALPQEEMQCWEPYLQAKGCRIQLCEPP